MYCSHNSRPRIAIPVSLLSLFVTCLIGCNWIFWRQIDDMRQETYDVSAKVAPTSRNTRFLKAMALTKNATSAGENKVSFCLFWKISLCQKT